MQFKLLKDWASFKKGTQIQITDEAVIKKGLAIGLFEELKGKKEDKLKE